MVEENTLAGLVVEENTLAGLVVEGSMLGAAVGWAGYTERKTRTYHTNGQYTCGKEGRMEGD